LEVVHRENLAVEELLIPLERYVINILELGPLKDLSQVNGVAKAPSTKALETRKVARRTSRQGTSVMEKDILRSKCQ
jgi:hypothetical protein